VLAPTEAADAAARHVLRSHLATLEREEARARRGEVEGVHQFRVATRRLRAALGLFVSVLPSAEVTRVHAGLASLAGAVGAVRDLDVLDGALSKEQRRLDRSLVPELAPVHREIADRRAAAHAVLLEVLDSQRHRTLLARVGALTRSAPGRPAPAIAAVAPGLVTPLWRRVLRVGRRLTSRAPGTDFHRLRVRAKRLRYALEALRSLGGKRVRRTLGDLEDLQDLLGAHQDQVTQIAWLRTYAETAQAPRATLVAVGALGQVLARRARRNRTRTLKAWKRFDRRGRRRRTLGELGGGRAVVPVRLVRASS
jgi:CHAD domain-containing protein